MKPVFKHISAAFLLLILSLATLPGAFYHQFEKHHDDAINHCMAEGHSGKHIEEVQIHCDIFSYEAPVYIEDFHWPLPECAFQYLENIYAKNSNQHLTFFLQGSFSRGPPMLS